MVAYDYGIKTNILRRLASFGCDVTVVPADFPAEKVRGTAVNSTFEMEIMEMEMATRCWGRIGKQEGCPAVKVRACAEGTGMLCGQQIEAALAASLTACIQANLHSKLLPPLRCWT